MQVEKTGSQQQEANSTQNLKVFLCTKFPKAQQIFIRDPNHFLNKRNLLYSKETNEFFIVSSFERKGIAFFGDRVLQGRLDLSNSRWIDLFNHSASSVLSFAALPLERHEVLRHRKRSLQAEADRRCVERSSGR
jgi:hypothetical protein